MVLLLVLVLLLLLALVLNEAADRGPLDNNRGLISAAAEA